MLRNQPSRFPSGYTNRKSSNPLGMSPVGDRSVVQEFSVDFNKTTDINATDYTTTAVGSSTAAVGPGLNGLGLLTTGASTNDAVALVLQNAPFVLVAGSASSVGKQLWYKARLKVSDASLLTFVAGLQVVNTTPAAANTQGVYFRKASATTALTGVVCNGTTESNLAIPATLPSTPVSVVSAVATNTFIDLAFYFNGNLVSTNDPPMVQFFVNNVLAGSLPLTYIPTGNLSPVLYVRAGEAVSKILTADFVQIMAER